MNIDSEQSVDAQIDKTERVLNYLKNNTKKHPNVERILSRMERNFNKLEITLFVLVMQHPFAVE
jgi:hypothetical protein